MYNNQDLEDYQESNGSDEYIPLFESEYQYDDAINNNNASTNESNSYSTIDQSSCGKIYVK